MLSCWFGERRTSWGNYGEGGEREGGVDFLGFLSQFAEFEGWFREEAVCEWVCCYDGNCWNLWKFDFSETVADDNSIIDYHGPIWRVNKLWSDYNRARKYKNTNWVFEPKKIRIIWSYAFPAKSNESIYFIKIVPKSVNQKHICLILKGSMTQTNLYQRKT